MIPNRDCGGASAGGAPDFNAYRTWVQRFAAGLGNRTAVVLLEPTRSH
jgi:endoglucanase